MTTHTEFAGACRWAGVLATDRPAWLAERRKYVTGTDVAAILGLHPFQTALDVFVDKTVAQTTAAGDTSEAMAWGRILEAPIRDEFARRFSRRMIHGGALLVSRSQELLAVTLDAEQYRKDREDPGIYEGKTTTAWKAGDWKADEPPPDYVQIQVQTQLLVTGARWADVFCLVGGQSPVVLEVEPLEELQEAIVQAVLDFWRDHVQAGVPPEPTSRDAEALAKLYPKEDGSQILLPVEAVVWSDLYADLGDQMRELKAEREELKNKIRAALGKASFGVLPADTAGGKGLWKNVTEERKAHSVKASSSRVARLVKPSAQAKLLREKGKPPALPEQTSWSPGIELGNGQKLVPVDPRADQKPPKPAKRRRSKRR
jgi:putative phage-type endonuclease